MVLAEHSHLEKKLRIQKMFNGEWRRSQSDSPEQLAKVLGIHTGSEVADNVLFDIIKSHLSAVLTTCIDETDDEVKIYRRFFFEDESAEDQDVHFGFNKECDFPMFNGQSIRGRFERDGWTRIVGNEGDLKVCYQIQEGKLVETITGNGFTFKQVSTENLYCSKLGIN